MTRRLVRVLMAAVIVAGAVTMIAPYVWLLVNSLKTVEDFTSHPYSMRPRPITISAYVRAFTLGRVGIYLYNSLFYAVIVTGLQLFIDSLAAFAFARLRFRFRDAVFAMVLATMMLPAQVTMIPMFILFNKAFKDWCERLGLPAEVQGRTVMETFPFLPERVREEYERVLATGETSNTGERTRIGEHEYITLTTKVPIEEAGEVVGVITIVQDITGERRLQEEMLKAQRLEALSLVAGSIAHDFNNLLAAVLTNLQAAQQQSSEPLKGLLEEALTASRRASRLR